jgi:3-oxoacyl-[acyl-carrier protein] reductase
LPTQLVVESDPALWAQTIVLNLVGVYYVTHAALPHLIAVGGGKIVNLGSVCVA